MSFISVLILCVLPLAFVVYELYKWKKYSKLPPGPRPVPILGNILELVGKKTPKHEIIAKLSEKYGDISTIWFFDKPTVILSSVEAVHEAYIDRPHNIASRSDTLVAVGAFDGYHNDLSFGVYNPRWQAKRKLFQQSVRTVTSHQYLEHETIDIINQLIRKMLQEGPDAPIDMHSYVHQEVFHAALILAFGKRLDFNDPELVRFTQALDAATDGVSACRFYDTFPIAHYLPIFKISPALRRMRSAMRIFQSYVLRWFLEAKEGASDDDPKHMVEAIVNGVNAVKEKASADPYSNTEIMHMLVNLFTASTSPTSSSMLWLILEMIMNPKIQEKCYEEICRVTNGRSVSLNDRRNMPYVEACIMETLRHHSPINLNLPHTPLVDTKLRDYVIPAGTETVLNIWALHHDPKVWKDPFNFNPENFLDENGQLTRPQNFFPFGAGRRVCPGEVYGRSVVFLTLTVMLQQLRLTTVDGHKYNTEWSETSSELINVPDRYPIRIEERK